MPLGFATRVTAPPGSTRWSIYGCEIQPLQIARIAYHIDFLDRLAFHRERHHRDYLPACATRYDAGNAVDEHG